MNDAVESFLVFHNATITGEYQKEYEGEILAVLDKKEEQYVLVVHQGDSVVTLFLIHCGRKTIYIITGMSDISG